MLRFILLRSLRALLTVFLVMLFVFFCARLTGDPFVVMFPDGITGDELKMFNEKFGLDQSIPKQLSLYIKNAVRFDFGLSIYTKEPVTALYSRDIAQTFKLASCALIVSVAAGFSVGLYAGLRPKSKLSRTLLSVASLGYTIPVFLFAIALILLFSYYMRLLPSQGYGSWRHYIMPVLSLAALPTTTITRHVRRNVMDVMTQDYIKTAYAKGIGLRKIITRHVLRNSFLALVTVLGIVVTDLVGGSIVVETIFSWPGMGKRIVEAVMYRDFPSLQFGVLCFSTAVVIISAAVDLLYVIIDPRIAANA